MSPLTLNALLAFILGWVFVIIGLQGYRSIRTSEDYFLAGRTVGTVDFGRSFAAASTSLATVLVFFVTLGIDNGIYILYAPITYCLGVIIFVRVLLPKIEAHGFFQAAGQTSGAWSDTLGGYLFSRYQSKVVELAVLLMAIVGLMSILLIEMYVGVQIFRVYVKEEFADVAIVVIAAIVLTYSGMGGMRAVVRTDKWQLFIMFGVSSGLLIWLCWQVWSQGHQVTWNNFFPRPVIFQGGALLPVPLLFNMTVVNILLIPAMLRTWQMAAAAPNAGVVARGMYRGAFGTFILTSIFVLIGILFFLHVYPNSERSLVGLLGALSSSGSWLEQYVLFPAFFLCCLSALISTADSAILPIIHTIWFDILGKTGDEKWDHSDPFRLCVYVLALALLLYFIVFRLLGFDMVSWLFTIFSFMIIAAPTIVCAVLLPERFLQTKFGCYTALCSLVGGFTIAVAMSLIGARLGRIDLVQLNSPIASVAGFLPFAALGGWLSWRTRRGKCRGASGLTETKGP